MTEHPDVSTPAADRRRFLFVMWEGGGNVPPQLALAGKLAARGHSVAVLADPCIRPDAERAGCRFVPFTRAPHRLDRTPATDFMRDWEARTPIGAFARIRDRVMFGPALAYAEDVLEEISANPVDVVAADYLLPGAAVGAEKAGVPTAILLHTIYQLPAPGMPGPGIGLLPLGGPIGRVRDRLAGGLFMSLFRPGLEPLNAARSALGLSPVSTVPEVFDRAERVLVLTSRAFDYEAERLPDNLRYVGPQLEDPAWTETWDSPWPADHPDPLVVVSLSTTPQNQAGTLQRVIDALGAIRVRGLVTTGPAVDPASLRVPGNVAVRRSAPHTVVFQQGSLVVTHAGPWDRHPRSGRRRTAPLPSDGPRPA